MASSPFALSSGALSAFSLYAPTDLTPEQSSRVEKALLASAEQVWKDASFAAAEWGYLRRAMVRDAPAPDPTDSEARS